MDKIVVDVADMLQRCQVALREGDAKRRDAAESVMSALVVWLRYDQALLPTELETHIKTLRKQ